ncbi:hypothetical protein [Gordonia sp. (in: high G+C Gram-positive bacteria)]|uniref:hypothetical protein n=1 Tax=Gordonia sp. (in: high G+C Gram-positive bacteria) TaxID=84139 RepID=UPI003C78F83F
MSTGTDVGARHSEESVDGQAAGEGSGSVPVWTVVLFVAACVLLVLAAMNLTNLGPWAAEHGQVLVFLGFFLVMSIAGRWFWSGVDSIVGAVRGNKNTE